MIPSIPSQSLRNLLIYASVLVAVVGLMVLPSYLAIGKTETALKKLESQVNEQRQLAPVFSKLVIKRREMNATGTNLPVRAALARYEAGSVSDALTRLVASTRMQMINVTSDLNAMVNDARLMRVDLVLRGELQKFDVFLKTLTRIPYFKFVEKLKISAVPGGQEYRMRVWIALK